MNTVPSKLDSVEKLTTGFSIQSKVSNRIWIALITASIVALINITNQEPSAVSGVYKIAMPFALGNVYYADFLLICVILLSALTLGFASAFFQAQKTVKLIWHILNTLPAEEKYENGIPLQAFADAWVLPTYSRVSPISMHFMGDYILANEPKPQISKARKNLNKIVYIMLKFAVAIIIFGLPLLVQVMVSIELHLVVNMNLAAVGLLKEMPYLVYIAEFFFVVAGIILLLLLIFDVLFIIRAIFKREKGVRGARRLIHACPSKREDKK
jgi:hypothetical protein